MRTMYSGRWSAVGARVATGLVLLLVGGAARGQSTPAAEASANANSAGANASAAGANGNPIQTFYLANISQINDANELTTALRNLLDPHDKVYLVASQNAIFVQGPPEQLVLARRLLNDVDRPKKTYRLTYTITEVQDGKRVGTQHFAMIVVTGQRTTLKQGSKVPVATGTLNGQNQTSFTYVDVGMNFDATLDEFANGVRLRSKVEQSSIAEEKSGVGEQDPIVRQTVLEGTSFLTLGKPLMLGSVDIPGSTRHMDVDVVMEQIMQ
jgi:type II secretory pathway component GspD/PulD (secretin)